MAISWPLLIGKSEYLHLFVHVLEAESLGLLPSLKMTISNDMQNVIFGGSSFSSQYSLQ